MHKKKYSFRIKFFVVVFFLLCSSFDCNKNMLHVSIKSFMAKMRLGNLYKKKKTF